MRRVSLPRTGALLGRWHESSEEVSTDSPARFFATSCLQRSIGTWNATQRPQVALCRQVA
jgi:hypothetical protein